MSVLGEERGRLLPCQLPGLLQLLLLGNGKPLDAPVQVAAKAADEIGKVAAKKATRILLLSMLASVQAGWNAGGNWPMRQLQSQVVQPKAQGPRKNEQIIPCRCFRV